MATGADGAADAERRVRGGYDGGDSSLPVGGGVRTTRERP
jgi:hypothetical protein